MFTGTYMKLLLHIALLTLKYPQMLLTFFWGWLIHNDMYLSRALGPVAIRSTAHCTSPAVTQLSPTLLTFTAASATIPSNNRRGKRRGVRGER